ncbi:MAG: hypothetical protein P8P74_18210 [Crocinitomicaceae bacterium]|nr:hypothetical protein [Crocinitomicaceae bacterium]
MKKLSLSLKKRISLLIVIGAILSSCSESSEELPLDDASPIEAPNEAEHVDSWVTIDTSQVRAWNNMRGDSAKIQNLVGTLKNRFCLYRPDEGYDSIYVYIGYDSEHGTINLFPIPASKDKKGNLESLSPRELIKGKMKDLPVTVVKDSTREDHITLADANKRINAWKNDTIRNNWIAANCDSSRGHLMGQIFVIRTLDMVHGDEHTCYLALDEDADATGGYKGDLIIVNTSTHEIVQPRPVISNGELTGVLEDVVHLGPPFKKIRTKDFGLLKTMGIE